MTAGKSTPRHRSLAASSASCAPSRSGFTLMEVLVALLLSGLLLSAAFVAIDLGWRYSIAGQDDVEQVQIARAVFQDMQRDVRSLLSPMPPPAPTEPPEKSGAKLAPDDLDTKSEPKSSVKKPQPDPPLILLGDAYGVALRVNDPSRPSDDSALFAPGAKSRGALSTLVVYAFVRDGKLVSSVLQQPPFHDVLRRHSFSTRDGLVRMEIVLPSLSLNAKRLSGARVRGELAVPEVRGLQFRYLDGQAKTWTQRWDNRTEKGLARAIEATLHVLRPRSTTSSQQGEAVGVFRNVINPIVAVGSPNRRDVKPLPAQRQ